MKACMVTSFGWTEQKDLSILSFLWTSFVHPLEAYVFVKFISCRSVIAHT